MKADKECFGNAKLCASGLQNALHGASPWPGSMQFEGFFDDDLVLIAKFCFQVIQTGWQSLKMTTIEQFFSDFFFHFVIFKTLERSLSAKLVFFIV